MIIECGKEIEVVRVSGDYYERGKQYGEICRDKIKRNIELCKDVCKSLGNRENEDIKKNTNFFIPSIKRFDPNLYREMKGISEGADVDIAEIVFLNARSELMNRLWGLSSVHEGCTTFATRANNNKSLFFAQTWDWLYKSVNEMIILVEKNEKGEGFLTITEAGIIGNVGINTNGVAVLLNYISVLETNYAGALYHVLLRRALEASNSFDMQQALCRSPISFAIFIMSGSPEMNISGYELTSTGIGIFKENNNSLLHTNHVLNDKLKCRVIQNALYDDSKTRYKLLVQELEKIRRMEHVSEKEIYKVLSSHGDEGSICKHFGGESDFEMGTIFSFVVEYENAKLKNVFLSFGSPCANKLKKLDMDEIFDF